MTESFDAVLAEMRALSARRRADDGDVTSYEVEDFADRLAAAHAAEVGELRDTNRRLNRRVQMGEAAVPSYQKLIAIPPDGDGVRFASGNFGRALLAWYCEKLTGERDAAEQDARRFDFVLEQLGADEAAALFCNKDMTAEEVRAAIDACMGEPASG
jgi:hypothetical protein